MPEYRSADVPGIVIDDDGTEYDAAKLCNDLTKKVEDLENELLETEESLYESEAAENSNKDRLKDIERIADRIRYATSHESEQAEVRALLSLYYPDSGNIRKLFG